MDYSVEPVLEELTAILADRRVGPLFKRAKRRMSRTEFRAAIIDVVSWLRSGYSHHPGINVEGSPEVAALLEFVPDLQRLFHIASGNFCFRDNIDEESRSDTVKYIRKHYTPPRRA